VTLYFLKLPNPEGSIRRVATRVEHGGHHIPEDVIRRRFDIGLDNFYNLYRDLVDYWYLYDNSNPEPVPLESGRKESNDEH
jgi:predicted ABC-type ATPase